MLVRLIALAELVDGSLMDISWSGCTHSTAIST